jgi:ketosteroid isomerase-like protein
VSANLDLVRSIYADWERGDFGSATWADPQIEFVFADGPSPGRWTGVSGMREGFRDFLSAWESYGVESAEYRELDPERVLAMVSFSGSGKGSELDLGQMHSKNANLFHIRDGKVTRLVLYWDRNRAFADLGMEP